MKKVIILVLLALIVLPILGQQHQLDVNASLDKANKCLVFSLENNNLKQNVVLKHAILESGPGSQFTLTLYDNEKVVFTLNKLMFHPTEQFVRLLPGEIKRTSMSLDPFLKNRKVSKVHIHCIVSDESYGNNEEIIKERYEKEYAFYWK